MTTSTWRVDRGGAAIRDLVTVAVWAGTEGLQAAGKWMLPYDSKRGSPQLPAQADEQRLERELGVQVELLELAPDLPDELAGTLGAGEPLQRRVLARAPRAGRSGSRALWRPSRRRRGRGTRRRAPRARRAAPRARRRAARGEAAGRPRAASGRGARARLRRPRAPRRRAPRPPRGCRRRGLARARTPGRGRRLRASVEQRVAAARRPPGRAGGRRDRAGRRRRARAPSPLEARARASRASITSRTARSDSRRNGTCWQRERIVSGSGPSSSATRTITAYGGGSSRSLSSASAASSFIVSADSQMMIDAALRLERAHVQVVAQRADVADPDLVADRLELVDVRMRVAEHAVGLADQLRRERERRRALADPARAVEEVRVRGRVVGERGAEEALRLGLLRKRLEAVHGSSRRAARAPGEPSTARIRLGKSSASSR